MLEHMLPRHSKTKASCLPASGATDQIVAQICMAYPIQIEADPKQHCVSVTEGMVGSQLTMSACQSSKLDMMPFIRLISRCLARLMVTLGRTGQACVLILHWRRSLQGRSSVGRLEALVDRFGPFQLGDHCPIMQRMPSTVIVLRSNSQMFETECAVYSSRIDMLLRM